MNGRWNIELESLEYVPFVPSPLINITMTTYKVVPPILRFIYD